MIIPVTPMRAREKPMMNAGLLMRFRSSGKTMIEKVATTMTEDSSIRLASAGSR